jgi:hypothetical protein
VKPSFLEQARMFIFTGELNILGVGLNFCLVLLCSYYGRNFVSIKIYLFLSISYYVMQYGGPMLKLVKKNKIQ